MQVAVDCTFDETGEVRVRRIKMGQRWISVGQGRQWLDENGRHVLIMLPDNRVRELLLRPATMRWELAPDKGVIG